MPTHPRFRDVKKCLTRDHGCTWSRENFFANDDVSLGKFRRDLPNGRGVVFAVADYDDDEEIEPELVTHICERLEIDTAKVNIETHDGSVVSVRAPTPKTPIPPPDLPN